MSYHHTSTALDEQTVLRTYSHEKLNLPFRILVKRVPKRNPEVGDWYNFIIKELNLDVEKSVSQAELLSAMRYYRNDIGKLGQQLFVGQDGFITTKAQLDKAMEFSKANLEYKRWQINRAGLIIDQVKESNWIQALLSDFCFFMAETLVELYEAGVMQNFDEMNRK